MKKIYLLITAAAFTGLTSCDNLLELDSETSITSEYLKTPDGIQREATALYYYDRQAATSEDGAVYLIEKMDSQTDLSVFRAGEHSGMWRMNALTPETSEFEHYWNHYYKIIGKSNEVISAAEAYGLDKDENVKKAWGEAKFFRGRSYFELYKRFERLYLNDQPTTVDNLIRDYTPASKESIESFICKDLDDAITALAWNLPQGLKSPEYGRVTKAVAKHVRAQVAMWQKDWDKAIEEAGALFSSDCPNHLEACQEDVFLKSENLTSPEILLSYQFSKNFGGGGSVHSDGAIYGHRISLITTAAYHKISGKPTATQGGYGWGRLYPNTYLFTLYNHDKDTRYKNMFAHKYYYDVPGSDKFGQEIVASSAQYITSTHPMSLKHTDRWTNQDQPDRRSSFRDLVVYRMGETAVMLAEAYLEKGDMANACKYYNMTWHRAGNDAVSTITMDDVIAEYARECNFEGVRWSVLKRRGILADQVIAHYGETKAENPLLNKDYAEARQYFIKGKHEVWPIPTHQIDLMGGNEVFPQHDFWK